MQLEFMADPGFLEGARLSIKYKLLGSKQTPSRLKRNTHDLSIPTLIMYVDLIKLVKRGRNEYLSIKTMAIRLYLDIFIL